MPEPSSVTQARYANILVVECTRKIGVKDATSTACSTGCVITLAMSSNGVRSIRRREGGYCA